MSLTEHVVLFSGGVSSWAAARRVAEKHGTGSMTLLFADTLIEDEDLYRFVDEASADIGASVVRIADGRTPWEVFRDERYLGNTRADPCSRVLKREQLDAWRDANCDVDKTTMYLGIDWTEAHRFERARARMLPWRVEAPMCEPPFVDKTGSIAELRSRGIRPPRLYEMGFPHNNCGGGCVKAGQGHFAHLLKKLPYRFAEWEREEQALRDYLGKDVAILRDRTGGTPKPLTLRVLRERIEMDAQVDMYEWGGCGCMTPLEAGAAGIADLIGAIETEGKT